MLRVTRSDTLTGLAGALLERFDADEGSGSGTGLEALFEAAPIVVPNRYVAGFLTRTVAEARGIAAGLEFVSLPEFLSGLQPAGGTRPRVLESEALHGLLLSVLADRATLDRSDLDPVRRYLDEGLPGAARDRRLFELAGHLARLFVAYAFDRPEWSARWRSGAEGGPGGAEARWQREIWREIFGPDGRLERIASRTGRRWALLPDALTGGEPDELTLPGSALVFLAEPPSPADADLLVRLADHLELHIFLHDPLPEDPRPTGPWIRPDRRPFLDRLRAAGAVFETRPSPAEAPGLLGHLQRAIVAGADLEPAAAPPPDGTVEILASPNLAREIETVARSIWEILASPGGPRLHEIAVLLLGNRIEEIQAQVRVAFRENHDLPCSVPDVPAATESRMIEAIGLLLALPLGSWTRQEFLALLTHPALHSRFEGVDPDEWIDWCVGTSILHGADRSDHEGTYVNADLYSWDQGIRRLILGTLGSRRDDGPYAIGDDAYLPEPVELDRLDSLSSFVLVVRSLVADARFAASSEFPLTRWARFFGEFLSSVLHPTSDEDERLLSRARERLGTLAEIDLEGEPVPYRIALEFASARLEGLRTRRGVRYPEGILVAGASSALPHDFRVIFAIGLSDGEFPRPEPVDGLDLRANDPRPGDVSARRRDLETLLEIVRSARERLFFTYRCRDETTGDPRPPAPALLELIELLGWPRPDPEARFGPIRWIPLVRHDEPESEFETPPAGRERWAAKVRRRLFGETSAPVELSRSQRNELAPFLVLEPDDARRSRLLEPSSTGPVSISIGAIRHFLESPLQGSTAFHLGLPEAQEDDLFVEDEPFAPTPWIETIVLREAFEAGLSPLGSSSRPDFGPILASLTRRAERAGTWPGEVFGEVARRRGNDLLDAWAERALGNGVVLDRGLATRSIGRAREGTDLERPPPALELSVEISTPDGEPRIIPVEIHGSTNLFRLDPPEGIVLLRSFPRDRSPGLLLRGYLDRVCLVAAGVLPPGAARLVVVGPGRDRCDELAPLDPEEARRWLGVVLADLLEKVHDHLLPLPAVVESWTRNESAVAVVRREIEKATGRFFPRGPIAAPEERPLPDEEEAARIVERRHRPFLEAFYPAEGGGETDR